MQHEFQLKKIGRMIGANSAEIQFYQTKQQELEAAIQEQQQEVLRLKAALEAEKRIRVNKQEYERIVETISKYRSRPDQLRYAPGPCALLDVLARLPGLTRRAWCCRPSRPRSGRPLTSLSRRFAAPLGS